MFQVRRDSYQQIYRLKKTSPAACFQIPSEQYPVNPAIDRQCVLLGGYKSSFAFFSSFSASNS